MKRFRIVIPEKRVEVVEVVYEVNAKDDAEVEEILEAMRDGNTCDSWEYIETKPNRWGFEVEDILYDEMILEELK